MNITDRPAPLSVQLEELAAQCQTIASGFAAVDPDRLCQIGAIVARQAECARRLERMLERRLGVRDIPWAHQHITNVVPLLPRGGNVVRLPVRGGVA